MANTDAWLRYPSSTQNPRPRVATLRIAQPANLCSTCALRALYLRSGYTARPCRIDAQIQAHTRVDRAWADLKKSMGYWVLGFAVRV